MRKALQLYFHSSFDFYNWQNNLVDEILVLTVNLEILVRNLFSPIALKDIFAMLRFCDFAWFTYISKRLSMSWGFYFHETSHVRSFAKIKPSWKFPNLQYCTCGQRWVRQTWKCACLKIDLTHIYVISIKIHWVALRRQESVQIILMSLMWDRMGTNTPQHFPNNR